MSTTSDEQMRAAKIRELIGLDRPDRQAAEQAYTMSAFDYEANPVGSEDWCRFWDGWRAALASQPVAAEPVAYLANGAKGRRFKSCRPDQIPIDNMALQAHCLCIKKPSPYFHPIFTLWAWGPPTSARSSPAAPAAAADPAAQPGCSAAS